MPDTWKIFGITVIILIAIISAVLLALYVSRGCNTNLDCNEDQYCAFNHRCYNYPTQTTRTINLLPSASVLGIAIIIASFVIRKKVH